MSQSVPPLSPLFGVHGTTRISPPNSARGSTTSPQLSPRQSYSKVTRLSGTHLSSGRSSLSGPESMSPTMDVGTALRDLHGETPLRVKETAVASLVNLSADPLGQALVIDGGAIPVLVAVLSAPWADLAIREGAAAALYNVSSEEVGRAAIARSAGIPALVGMLEDPEYHTQTRQLATAILRMLCTSKDCKKALIHTHGIEVLVGVIESFDVNGEEDTAEAKLNAISVMQALSFTDDRVVIDWGKRGVLAALIRFMELKSPRASAGREGMDGPRKSPRSAAVATAATVLQNLSVYEENKDYIVDAGGVRIMMLLLAQYRADVQVQMAAASVLFNLAVSPQCCLAIVQEGAVPTLLETLREHHPSADLRKFTAGTLQYLSATEEGAGALREALTAIAESGSLFVQNLLGDEEPEEISRHIAGLARNLTLKPDLLPPFLVEESIVPGLVEQLRRSYMYDTKEDYLIACLHYLAFYVPRYKVVVAAAGGMDVAFKFLAFGNLRPGALERIAALLQTLTVAPENELRFGPSLFQFLGLAVNPTITMRAREFIMGAVQNVSVHPENKDMIVQAGGIGAMLSIVRDKESSAHLVECALGVLQNLSNAPAIKAAIADPAVVKVVLGRLTEKDGRHATEKEKEHGMAVLLNVCTVDAARVQLAATGVVSLAIRMMNSQVTTLACKQYSAVALHRVCCRQDDLLVGIRREGGAMALKRVVDALPDSEAQQCVRWTLHRLENASA